MSIPLTIAGAFEWTVYEMAGHRALGAVYKYWAQRQDLRLGRDQFDECAYSLSEIDLCFSNQYRLCRAVACSTFVGWLCHLVHDSSQVCRRSRASPQTGGSEARWVFESNCPVLCTCASSSFGEKAKALWPCRFLCLASVNVSFPDIAGPWTQPHLDSVRNSQICIATLTILPL